MRFSDFVTLKRGFDLPKTEMQHGQYPVIGSTSIIGHHDEFKVNPPGVITGRSGSLGVVQYTESKFWPHNTSLWVKDFKGNDPKFVYYCMMNLDFARFNAGAGVPTLNRNHLDSVEVNVPPLPIQQRIAGILSAYDELIENSQRRIKILESMARALYREWFVHFRFPGHENNPRVGSSLGEIPQGWEVKRLNKIVSSHIGGGWGKEVADQQYIEPASVIRGTDIPDARFSQITGVPYRFHTVSNIRSRKLSMGDIVFEVSGGSKGQPVGRTLLITNELLSSLGGNVICASFCKRIQPDSVGYGSELLYLSFLEGYESGEIEQYQVQSTGISNFKWTDYLENTIRVVPPKVLREQFRGHVAPLLTQVATLGGRIQNLRNTRDMLLPRLLSGQLEIKVN